MIKNLLTSALFLLSSAATALSPPQPPELALDSYALLDFHSGQLIAGKDADKPVEPASLTKIMTTYVAFDELRTGRIKMEDQVVISERAWRSQGSRSFIEVGKRVKLEDLLHGSIVQSGNDASIAIAEHIAGDEGVFAQLMNKHAQRLGMKNTFFTNATGLPDPQLRSSARDMALLSQALIRDFPELYPWFKEREFVWNGIRQQNRNMLLDLDPSADGIKTGHTEAAGYCLAASAQRDGRRLIAVVMGSKGTGERARAAKALLDFGYRFYETATLLGAARPAATVRVWKGAELQVPVGVMQPVSLSLPRGAGDDVEIRHQLRGTLVAPLKAGQVVGTLSLVHEGKTLREAPLVALKDVAEGSLWQRLTDGARLWLAD